MKLILKAIGKTLFFCALPVIVVGMLKLAGDVGIIIGAILAISALFGWAYKEEKDKVERQKKLEEAHKRAIACKRVEEEFYRLMFMIDNEYSFGQVQNQAREVYEAAYEASYYEVSPATYRIRWEDKIKRVMKDKNYL